MDGTKVYKTSNCQTSKKVRGHEINISSRLNMYTYIVSHILRFISATLKLNISYLLYFYHEDITTVHTLKLFFLLKLISTNEYF